MAKVFISYSRKDIDFAKRLTREFQKSDLDVWIDWEEIPPTVDWWKEIEKGIEESDAFLFLISPDSTTSKICRQEIDHAIINGKRIIPIVVREVNWEDTPPQLGHLNYIFFSRGDDFDTAIRKLLTAIHTDYEWAATHRRLQVKALEWERIKKENSFLLRGKDLGDAELQLATNSSKEPYPTDLQREYVFHSRKAADRQRRIITGISIIGIIALAALAVFGFYQAGQSSNNAATAQANLVIAKTAQVESDKNAATAIANEQEAIKQAQIALARQLASQAESIDNTFSSNQVISTLLDIQSMKLFPNGGAANFLINGNKIAINVSHMTHNDAVSSVAFSPDGKYVVSGSADGTARVWEATSGKEIARMTHDSDVLSVAFSPDGKYVVSGSVDGTARVWEATSGQEIARMTHDGHVVSIAFSSDGKSVVSGSADGTARVWEAASGQEIARMTHHGIVNSVAFSPSGEYIVSGSFDRTARVWDAATGKEIARMTHDKSSFDFPLDYGVWSVAFSPDGKYVVSGSRDNTARVWDAMTGKEIARMIHGITHDSYVLSVAFSPDGKYIVSGSGDGTAWVWDAATGKEIARITHNNISAGVLITHLTQF